MLLRIVSMLLLVGCASTQNQDPLLLIEKGMYDTAEKEINVLLEVDPRSPQLKDALGAALAGQGRYQEACPKLGVSSQPLSAPKCWLQAAKQASQQKRWKTVVSYARRVNTSNWSTRQVLSFYTITIAAALKLSDWDHLIKAYPILLDEEPKNADYHYKYARALEQRKYYDKAYKEYSLAAQLDPENEDVKRYMNRLKARMNKTGAVAAARVEDIKSKPSKSEPETELSRVRVSAWEHGSVEALIEIEEMDEVSEQDDISTQLIAVPVEIITAHWPRTADKNQTLGYISRLAMELQCPAVGENGTATVTVGPDGTVKKIESTGIKDVVVTCLQREISSWIFNSLRGGYLKFSIPFPLLDEADLYGSDIE